VRKKKKHPFQKRGGKEEKVSANEVTGEQEGGRIGSRGGCDGTSTKRVNRIEAAIRITNGGFGKGTIKKKKGKTAQADEAPVERSTPAPWGGPPTTGIAPLGIPTGVRGGARTSLQIACCNSRTGDIAQGGGVGRHNRSGAEKEAEALGGDWGGPKMKGAKIKLSRLHSGVNEHVRKKDS